MKKCSNCGKMNLNDAECCSDCQCEFASFEVEMNNVHFAKDLNKLSPEEKREKLLKEEIEAKDKGGKKVEGCLASVISFIPLIVILHILRFIKQLFTPVNDMYSIENTLALFPSKKDSLIILILAAVISILIGVSIVISWKLKSPKEKMVQIQFEKDQTSICPSCGSHSVSLGRKGYDWNKGFWYRIFDIKGGHYLAGMDSRRVIAHCNSCGHKWETDKEWIR